MPETILIISGLVAIICVARSEYTKMRHHHHWRGAYVKARLMK